MGYAARLDLRDGGRRRWVGVHTPACANLAPLFEALIAEDGLPGDLDALLEHLPPGAAVRALLGPRVVALDLPEARGPVVLKLVPPSRAGPLDALFHAGEGSRARRAHLVAHRIRALGVGAPRPLGYLERRRGPRAAASAVVSGYAPHPTLRAYWSDALAPLAASDPAAFVRDKRRRLGEVAHMLRVLHGRGLLPADLHAENILVTPEGVLLVDLEAVRTGRQRARVTKKSLVRLHRDFLDLGLLTRADRMRFLAAYTRHEAGAPQRRRSLWRAVAAGTAAKLGDAAFAPSVESRPAL